ncbi:MAG: NADH-quinone oxidoreductase subunit N [Caldilineaceae bacterium SB0662_bin_9]|uniref:NADH-quinone oxidoreductase subunit N n=1 Tax=Caldilineaceae bacterium SB0662_bin_9 TaxID=2605258 RepID=A0A6B1DP85_9CHLR|nr:NADH-quinone oxidoreductase subunit N [Caldilineaceae bacterium]MXZ40564.1 NADH-quinone oxidoreductase subunit N [Caldilineaceae bacterium SB0666_bin_21]MYD89350.1 NADH-quinone oxidoreductase subunit N [Caldilineaceae bacterium SB0662_bin_9]
MNLNYSAILPEMVMAGGAIVVLMVDALRRIENHRGDAANRGSGLLLTLSLIVAAGSTVAAFAVRGESGLMFQDSARSDALSFGIRLIVLATTILVLLVGSRYVSTFTRYPGEYYSLLLLSATGMMAMGIASDLMVLFIALETFSLSLILLAGMYRHNRSSTEASLKYFLLGAFASGFFVYGSALIYGVTGTVSFAGMGPALQVAADGGPGAVLLWAGIALLLVGFGFKLSLVPFHMWTPDVYQGAPTSVTAFMSVGTKTAMFGALVRIFLMTFPYGFENWTGPLIVLAVLTMTVGNVTALCQTSIKRMLGYSGIAHAGYVLAGLVPGTETAVNSALFYLFAYAFMNIGAFIIVMAIEHSVETDVERSQLRGTGAAMPVLAGFMALFLFSLSGIPPLAGFFGKFLIFRSILDGGLAWLAAVVVVNSAVSAYYYLRIVVTMYFQQRPQEVHAPQSSPAMQVGMVFAGVMVLAIGVFPAFFMGLLTVPGL